MTNKDYILKITDLDKRKRLEKISSCLIKEPIIQVGPNEIINIILPAKNQENKTTIMAHHDLFPGSLGYNDNSTGVVTLLKLQEHMTDEIELVFTDKEEYGGHGCAYYLETNIRPKQAINVDVVGLGDRIFYEKYGTGVLTFSIPEHMEYYKRIPFSDSHMLRNYKVPNILMLTGYCQHNLIQKIFEAQHNGIDDGNMDLIQESTMDLVFNTIVKMIEEISHGKPKIGTHEDVPGRLPLLQIPSKS